MKSRGHFLFWYYQSFNFEARADKKPGFLNFFVSSFLANETTWTNEKFVHGFALITVTSVVTYRSWSKEHIRPIKALLKSFDCFLHNKNLYLYFFNSHRKRLKQNVHLSAWHVSHTNSKCNQMNIQNFFSLWRSFIFVRKFCSLFVVMPNR